MATYATLEQLREELGLEPDDEEGLSDVDGERALREAERAIDRIAGPRVIYSETGRKYRLDTMGTAHVAAVREATLLVAAAVRTDSTAPRPVKSEAGPDFRREYADTPAPASPSALRAAAAILDDHGLRTLTAVAR